MLEASASSKVSRFYKRERSSKKTERLASLGVLFFVDLLNLYFVCSAGQRNLNVLNIFCFAVATAMILGVFIAYVRVYLNDQKDREILIWKYALVALVVFEALINVS